MSSSKAITTDDSLAEDGAADFDYRCQSVDGRMVLQWWDAAATEWIDLGPFEGVGQVTAHIASRHPRYRPSS